MVVKNLPSFYCCKVVKSQICPEIAEIEALEKGKWAVVKIFFCLKRHHSLHGFLCWKARNISGASRAGVDIYPLASFHRKSPPMAI